MYCDRIKRKLINPKPKIKIKRINNSVSYIDADNSIGFVAADVGIKQAIKILRKQELVGGCEKKWTLWSLKFLC